MKKTILGTALATALGLVSVGANAAAITSLNVTYGDFGMNTPPDGPGGVNDWSGVLNMGTSGVLIPAAFNFNGIFGNVDLGADGSGLSGDDTTDLDLSNFAIDWNGNHVAQPNGAPGATFGPGNTFSVDFTAPIATGPFAGNTGYWHMEGTYTTSAVPVPAAAWLFGSAVLGMVGVGRRRKSLVKA